jgi:hypothetical protein
MDGGRKSLVLGLTTLLGAWLVTSVQYASVASSQNGRYAGTEGSRTESPPHTEWTPSVDALWRLVVNIISEPALVTF